MGSFGEERPFALRAVTILRAAGVLSGGDRRLRQGGRFAPRAQARQPLRLRDPRHEPPADRPLCAGERHGAVRSLTVETGWSGHRGHEGMYPSVIRGGEGEYLAPAFGEFRDLRAMREAVGDRVYIVGLCAGRFVDKIGFSMLCPAGMSCHACCRACVKWHGFPLDVNNAQRVIAYLPAGAREVALE